MAALDDLIAIYKEAQLALIRIITGNTGAGTKTYYNSVLKQTEALLNRLSAQTGRYISTEIPAEYKTALGRTYDYFRRNNLQMNRPDMFAQIHSDAVSELAAEMQHHINEGISSAGRRVIRYADSAMDNALRQNGLRASALKIASGQTVRDMQKDLTQRLSEDGFLTVQYGSGKNAYQVGLDSYAAMVARSTTREAGNLARENQLTENGYDLMIITEHKPCCELCARVQGRVFSISGNDKRFPPLSAAFPSGYRNVHPNCRCVAVPWIEELQSPEELRAAIAKGSQPLKDERSAKEKALYTQQQSDSRQMRADLVQYQRYKARLGDDAPKSFSAFRRMKNAGGDRWEALQKEYRQKFEKVDIADNAKTTKPVEKASAVEETSGFKQAKTIEEAEKFALENGVRHVDYSDLPLETANLLNEAAMTLPEDIRPAYIGSGKSVQKVTGKKFSRKEKDYYGVHMDVLQMHFGEYPNIEYDFEGGNVVGISTAYKTPEKIHKSKVDGNKAYAEKHDGHTQFFNEDGRSTAFHEMGHIYADKKGVPEGFAEDAERWLKESKCDMLKSTDEAWAEAWGAYHTKNPDLPDYIAEYVEKVSNAPIDKSAKGGIIEEKEELPRKIKSGSNSVDWSIVQSEEYSKKFTKLSDDERVSSAIETRAKWALNNRDGKNTEELYAISLKNGREVSRITDQNYDSAVKRTSKFTRELNATDESGEEILLLHNHPRGLPPSISDINALLKNKNVLGITVGHNGSIYRYTRPNKEIPLDEWNIAMKHFKEFSETTAMEKSLEILSRKFEFIFEKI